MAEKKTEKMTGKMTEYLETERLILRPLSEQDYETACVYACDDENTHYMLFYYTTREEQHKVLKAAADEWKKEDPAYYEYAVLYENRHVGAVSLYLNDERTEGEIGWVIRKDYWGKGIAAEAAAALLQEAKKSLALTCVNAHCDARNIGSYRVMEKLGMTPVSGEGTRYYERRGETAGEKMCTVRFKEVE